ncbi:conserved hypothetical protein [Syntrophaceticus schinkii]|uniref:Uncharacterized protein n=1 Tax=Syntrophaceticus schinkii TaxID=499207 RepID=A0A0B7MQJ3_9FIRM|nr:conserved hypothetical protein [Syntrophaceticus schinkii]
MSRYFVVLLKAEIRVYRREKDIAKKVTSREVATKASKLLRSRRTSNNTKFVAGSALSQREKKR